MQMSMEHLLTGSFSVGQEQVYTLAMNAAGSKRRCETHPQSYHVTG